jgi:DNA polymerase (family 10)
LNAKYGVRFHIFKGIESDILADGSLDYPDDVMNQFDFVVASVHSRFRIDPREQTERILRAVAHPRTTILGHMTGRQLLRRPGYEIDIQKVLKPAPSTGSRWRSMPIPGGLISIGTGMDARSNSAA